MNINFFSPTVKSKRSKPTQEHQHIVYDANKS